MITLTTLDHCQPRASTCTAVVCGMFGCCCVAINGVLCTDGISGVMVGVVVGGADVGCSKEERSPNKDPACDAVLDVRGSKSWFSSSPKSSRSLPSVITGCVDVCVCCNGCCCAGSVVRDTCCKERSQFLCYFSLPHFSVATIIIYFSVLISEGYELK